MKEPWQMAVERMPLWAAVAWKLNLLTDFIRMPSQYLMISILIASCQR